ncbi:transcription factor HHO2 [Solanum pennellii]|uniref:Transcription factor HHO2 n=1 Tax=Solanum pennellii TaxID=28526 RepID=A0ABM1GRF1_SOLPN|nr:transcription factor HHO2 [Solanum pennellii]
MMSNNNFSDKMERCQQYIDALEQERTKIQVFSRELPLCLELVTQAIETYKQQLSGTTIEYNLNAQSTECSDDEHTSSDVPILEEFIPLKSTFSHEDEDEDENDEENQSHKSKSFNNTNNSTSSKDTKNKKSDWLRSVQLWNQTSDPTPKEELTPKKVSVVEVKKNGSGGAFHPFKKEKNTVAAVVEMTPAPAGVVLAATGSSTVENGGESKKEDKDGQRKQRRCWSPELHRRFLHALQQLGGSHVATPKQIRELMKVDGLTNDEVKSHLQKYRLHTRRPSPSSIHNNNNQQPPQFVVVGGIWVPPPEYASMAAGAPAASGEASGVAYSNGIYAPIATHPKGPLHDHASGGTLRQHNNKSSRSERSSERDGSHSHSDCGGVHSNSPATSSSTHTTTASPAY